MTTFISKVTTIRPGIIRILGCNPGPMTLQGTNTYLIGTGTKRVLLDVGEARNAEYITSLESVLQQQNTTINQIVISHWHHDHIGGLKDVLKCLPEPVSVYKIPRFDKDDDPMLNLTTYIPLKHLDEIKTQEATLRNKTRRRMSLSRRRSRATGHRACDMTEVLKRLIARKTLS
ncbi:endoribonuclease LACTB2-like isoform X2 [Portunus trituberculatus]|uniref:endoribonuclease LACTB2-like isoform X2 n=1 Tax=Portunus trituberculatus TaxID=210409 RepID=UPI001E1D2158|nr:endoribonuclease LACTB2-like isoform X2 [Portunus trituberculatus]